MRQLAIVLLALVSTWWGSTPLADDAEPLLLKSPAPRTALLFKSGQAYLERSVPLDTSARSVRIELPRSIHGTVWLGATSHRVESAHARIIQSVERTDAGDWPGILRMSEGRIVDLDLGGEPHPVTARGRVIRLLDPEPDPEGLPTFEAPSTHVALDTGDSIQVVPLSHIRRLTLAEHDAIDWAYNKPVDRPVLDVVLAPTDGKKGDSSLVLANMASGLAWAPSYILELRQEGRAKLTGKAVVVNDL